MWFRRQFLTVSNGEEDGGKTTVKEENRMRKALFPILALILALGSALPMATPALAVGTSSPFELDGNAQDGNAKNILPDDWDSLFPVDQSPNDIVNLFLTDTHTGPKDPTVFKVGSKDTDEISGGTVHWHWDSMSVPDKNDIQDAYFAVYSNNGHLVFYYGLDRPVNDGDANIGFWFLRNAVGLNTDGTFSGAHSVGDLFVVCQFTNGGEVKTLQLYKWIGGANPLELLVDGAQCGADPVNFCGITNEQDTPAPWPYTPKHGTPGIFPPGCFFEGMLDTYAILGQNACFTTFIAETRVSQKLSAELKDFVLGEVNLVDCNITAASPVCAGSTGNTASVPDAGAGATYAWSVDKDAVITDGQGTANMTYTAGTQTPITISVIVTKDGCSNTCTKQVTVTALPSCSITTDDPVCAGSSHTATGPDGMDSYTWTVTGGTLDSGQGTQTIDYTAGAGPKVTIDLTVQKTGCQSNCSKEVNVTSLPACSITCDPSSCTICEGGSITLSAPAAPVGKTYTYLWSPDGQTAREITVTPLVTTTYSVKVTDSDTGCYSTCTKDVTVNSLPACSITCDPSSCTISAGGSIKLSAPAGTNYTYLWSPGNETTREITVSPLVTTEYTVKVTDSVTNCYSTCKKTVTVSTTQLASIGDFVWKDANCNGIQDPGEPGIDGVTVNLFKSDNTPAGTTTTAGGGKYLFSNLQPGNYYVQFVAPTGYVFSPKDQGGDDAKDSDADPSTGRTVVTTLDPGETDLTWDAGIDPVSIGDFVWQDTNCNGIQDNAEPGIGGVTVNLFKSDNTPAGTTTTDVNGKYGFADLPPGDYYLVFTAPPGYTFSPRDQGSNDAVDSDADPATGQTVVTTLVAQEQDLTWDAGLCQKIPPPKGPSPKPPAATVVGGIIMPMDKVQLLVPWIWLAALMVLTAGVGLVLRGRMAR